MGTYLWLRRCRSRGSPPPERSTQKLAVCRVRVTARGDEGRPPHSFRTRSPRTARQGGAPCALRKCVAPRGFLGPGRTECKEGGLRSLQHRRGSKPGEVRLGSGGLGRLVVSKSESWYSALCAPSPERAPEGFWHNLRRSPPGFFQARRPSREARSCVVRHHSQCEGWASDTTSFSFTESLWDVLFRGFCGGKRKMPLISACPTKGDLA